jgi:hypothetical protein
VLAGNEEVAVFKEAGGDEDDLLAALDEALDELEAEQKIEAAREAASPAWDSLEITPSNEEMVRAIIDGFLGRRRDLPRPDHHHHHHHHGRRRMSALDRDLGELLGASMARARSSLERRRARVWVCSAARSAR